MCRIERWNVRTLRAKIGGMLFDRTAMSRKPEELVKQELAKLREGDTLTPDLVFRDPYYPGTEEAHTNPTRQRGECLRALAGAVGLVCAKDAKLSCRGNIFWSRKGYAARINN